MSEEEIIKDLTNYISFANKSENFSNDHDFRWNTEVSQRVQGLLDLYNKEKEKNKELKTKIERINEIIDTSPYTAYTAYGNILYDDQAIRDVIEDTNKFEGEIW